MSTYDKRRVFLVLGGTVITGYKRGQDITLTSDADTFTDEAGMDVGWMRSKVNDNRAEITFTLLSNSPSNDWLNTLSKADKTSNAGVRQFFIKDANFVGTIGTGVAWVKRNPDLGFSSEEKGRQWTLRIMDYDQEISGGTQSFIPAIQG
jgi:hypothetical protein